MAGEVTPNMSLALVPTSNFVTPEDFNRNFEKLDALGLDYVTEFGTSGEWWFRKWKSGRAQCGIDYKEFGDATLVPWAIGAHQVGAIGHDLRMHAVIAGFGAHLVAHR